MIETTLQVVLIWLAPWLIQLSGTGQQSHPQMKSMDGITGMKMQLDDTNRQEPVMEFLRKYLTASLGEEDNGTHVSMAFVALRGTEASEVIAYVSGRYWCGSGGCTTFILAPDGSSYKLVTEISITRPPIRVLDTRSNGWHDIAVRVQGGGIVKGYDARLPFDGSSYPDNPTVSPARPVTEKSKGLIAIPMDNKGTLLYR